MMSLSELPNGMVEDAAALAIKEGLSVESGLAFSQAISLKRIADAMWGIEGTAGVLHLLNPLDVRNNY
jgi:hypothetical protein